MMKFFSEISKEDIHITPGKKIIPQKEYSTLKDAHEILEKAKKDIKDLKKKTKLEAEQIKEEAYAEGFADGLRELNEHILLLDNLAANLAKEVKKQVLPIAINAAKKILGEELKIRPDAIVDLVMQALKPVVQHHHVTLYVNKDDLKVLESKKTKIKKMLLQVETFSIQERADIEKGGCIIETEAGIINAQLENQWLAMEAAFRKFIKK